MKSNTQHCFTTWKGFLSPFAFVRDIYSKGENHIVERSRHQRMDHADPTACAKTLAASSLKSLALSP